MIRVTNSIALRFDVIGKTLETLMDKQLMKTTVNDELSSEKNMPERKSVLRQENYLIIPLKTFFGDTLGGGYVNPAKRNVMVVKNEMRLLKQKRNVLQI